MMKKLLLLAVFVLASTTMWAQSVTINETGGWLESAWVKWAPVSGATSYNVYYTGGGVTNQKIDNQLIRSYGTYMRADVMGIKAGSYTIKIAPVTSGVEGTATETASINVVAHDRNGFAFDGGRVPGGYKADGTPKDGAVIIYVSDNTKNTVTFDVITSSKGATTNCIGLQNILYAVKKGYDTRPYIIRLIGNITDLVTMEGGDIVIENANNPNSYLTLEGVGDDAVGNGWGVRIKTASNIEVRNMASMNCNSTAGDDFGLQQDNDHIWVHNCDMFYGNAGSDADQIKGDGALDNKNSTYITFSYNHFWDNGKCSLLGLSEGTTSGLYITYHHNWFDHSDSRHPRVRYYSAHVYNNYYDGNAKYGVGSTLGSSVFVEGNYFRNCKRPMMTSLQGTDIWDEVNMVNNANTIGTFSGEAGGTIKAFNNKFDYTTVHLRFVPYGSDSAAFNIAGKISALTDFDAYLAKSRGETVPATVVSKSGANTYNNFDTDASKYIKNLVIDEPDVAKAKTMQYAGRVNGGDLKFTFNNAVDDAAYLVNMVIKTALTNYTSSLVSVQGEATPAGSQTLTSTSNNNQTVTSGNAISNIVFTWGADATDATVTGIPANGITYVKNATAKTITISGIPTDSVAYEIVTSGTKGTPAAGSGLIVVTAPSSQTLSSPANNYQTVNKGTAIADIVYTWGGTATAATVTGLDGSGLVVNTDATAKTVTISGTPTATVAYTISTSGTSGTAVSGSGTITVTNISASDMIHNFTVSGTTSTFFTIVGNMNSSPGTTTYDGLTLNKCMKIESSTSVKFTTTAAATLTLVLDAASVKKIAVDGTAYTAVAGVVTAPIAAGAHTISKTDVTNLYYIKVVYNTTGIESTNSAASVKLYPNPVTSTLSVASESAIESVELYSLSGVLLKREAGNVNLLDMSGVARGSYLVKVITEQGVAQQKIVKR